MAKAKTKTKAKTKKSLARRVKVTPTGKVLRRSAFGRHLRRKKSKSQLRRYNQEQEITGTVAKKIKKLLAHVK